MIDDFPSVRFLIILGGILDQGPLIGSTLLSIMLVTRHQNHALGDRYIIKTNDRKSNTNLTSKKTMCNTILENSVNNGSFEKDYCPYSV